METKLSKTWTLISRNLEGENYRHTVIGHSVASYYLIGMKLSPRKKSRNGYFGTSTAWFDTAATWFLHSEFQH